ncbi:hypothetical protein D3C85_1831620 [compost metagenome]
MHQRQVGIGVGHGHGRFAVSLVDDNHRGVRHHAVGLSVCGQQQRKCAEAGMEQMTGDFGKHRHDVSR